MASLTELMRRLVRAEAAAGTTPAPGGLPIFVDGLSPAEVERLRAAGYQVTTFEQFAIDCV